MSRKQVFYFYEGETEKKLLEFLKNTKKISSGKVRKFNLSLLLNVKSIPLSLQNFDLNLSAL
jgi:hypothetical protein